MSDKAAECKAKHVGSARIKDGKVVFTPVFDEGSSSAALLS